MDRRKDCFILGIIISCFLVPLTSSQQRQQPQNARSQQQSQSRPQPQPQPRPSFFGSNSSPNSNSAAFGPAQAMQRNQQPLQMFQDQQLANMVAALRNSGVNNNNVNPGFSSMGFPSLQMSPGLSPEISISPVIPQPEPLQMNPVMLPQTRMIMPPQQRQNIPMPMGISGDPYYAQGYTGGMGGGAMNNNPYGSYNPYSQGSTYGQNGQNNAYGNGMYGNGGGGGGGNNGGMYGGGTYGGMNGGMNNGGNNYGNNAVNYGGNGGSGNYAGMGGGSYGGGGGAGNQPAPPVQECVCTEEYLPICGSDGQTYTNLCKLRCDNLSKPYVQAVSKGECTGTNPGSGTGNTICNWQCDSRAQTVCDSAGKRYLNQCVFWKNVCQAAIGGSGTLVPTLAACPITGVDTPISPINIIVRDATTPSSSSSSLTTTTAVSHTGFPLFPMTNDIKTNDNGIVLRSLDAFDPLQAHMAMAKESVNTDPLVVQDLSDR